VAAIADSAAGSVQDIARFVLAGQASRRCESPEACRGNIAGRVAYGPVDEPDGQVARSNSVNGGVVDNAIYVDGIRTANPATLDETYELLRERHGMAWIGLYRPTPGEIRSVAAEFGLHHLVVDDAIAAHQRPKLERYGDILFTVLRPARYIDQREQVEFGELHVVTGDGFVVTIRHAESPISQESAVVWNLSRIS
jgi:hypothetical protein